MNIKNLFTPEKLASFLVGGIVGGAIGSFVAANYLGKKIIDCPGELAPRQPPTKAQLEEAAIVKVNPNVRNQITALLASHNIGGMGDADVDRMALMFQNNGEQVNWQSVSSLLISQFGYSGPLADLSNRYFYGGR